MLVDPLAKGIDLAPLNKLMADPSRTKVFHAARQDLEIFTRLIGHVPGPMFDTQIAAMACGLGDSISYENLVARVVKGTVDKSSQFTDWARRPLTEKQLTYARGDVVYLREIYKILRDKLEKQNRHGLDRGRACRPARSGNLRVRSGDGVEAAEDPQVPQSDYLAVLANVAAWRERVAQETDKPRGRILKDDAIQEIAQQKPRTAGGAGAHARGAAGLSANRGMARACCTRSTRRWTSRTSMRRKWSEPERSGPPPGAIVRTAESAAEAGVG